MSKKIDVTEYYNKTFELMIQIKDHQGNPTGRTKTIATDEPSKLAYFWYRNRAPQKKKKGKNNANGLPNAQQANNILKAQYGDK